MKVEEVCEPIEVTQGFWQLRKMVVTKVEHTELFQAADVFGDFGESVVSQDECFELGLLPHGVWHAAMLFLPKIQMPGGFVWHEAILKCSLAGSK